MPAAKDKPSLLAAVLPQDCVLCGKGAEAGPLCAACDADLPRHGASVCPRCGDNSVSGEECGRCLREPPHFDATIAAFVYAFPIDRLELHFKYGGALHLARWWASKLLPTVRGFAADLIVPMPLHALRLRERGYNQALEICRHLAPQLGIPVVADLCERTRATPPQASLDRDARLSNVRGAFSCRTDLAGKRLLILDDVMTTGASMNELARTLKMHGAASVVALVAARTLHA